MKSILITGGTGFLGNALAERLNDQVERICIFARNEGNMARMRARFPGRSFRWFLGDVRDYERLRRAMDGVEGVIHAAALKRIEEGVSENAWELIQTNIIGTHYVVEAAKDRGVKSVVLVSSDKAYAPASGYGGSKLGAECLFLEAALHRRPTHPQFHIVRYGNVWGSTGSVVPRWREAQRLGQRIRVTDTAATRFFMSDREAVDFVLGALMGQHPPALIAIPNWLPAYSLGDLLAAMDIKEFDITGLPWYEKLHESMTLGVSSDRARRMTVEELRALL